MTRWLDVVRGRGARSAFDLPVSVLRSPTTQSRYSPLHAFQRVAARIENGGSLAPLALVAVTLIALVVAPMIAELYTRPLFEELRTVTAPAQQLLTRVHVSLALEGSTLDDFTETGNPMLAERYLAARDAERAAEEELGQLVGRLGPLVQQRYAAMRTAERRWHAAAETALLAGPRGAARTRSERDELYQAVLTAAARLDEGLDAAVTTRRDRIRDAVRLQRRTSIALSILALLALGAVAMVARRLRAAAVASREARLAMEQVMDSKARLMRGVSHDLKNPLHAIDGFAVLLADGAGGALSEQQRRSVERIRAGVASVLGLVKDLLELSRAEVGQLALTCEPVDLRNVVRDAVEQHRGEAEHMRHSIDVVVPSEELAMSTDSARVQQVLGNLLSNAIKYTPPGGRIRVEVAMRPVAGSRTNEEWMAVDVTDTGPGIPEDQLEAVFDEFTRLNGTDRPGAGLGLAIAQRIARLLGGTLTLESRVGSGSRFTLWLPVACAPRPMQGARRVEPMTAELTSMEDTMHALAWIGIVVLALALLTWFVFKVTIWFAALLFVVGLGLLLFGFVKVKRAV